MTPIQLNIAIQTLLSLIVLAIIVFWLWPAQRVDLFRQQLFEIRDELFDFAAAGNIRFDDPSYLALRQLMNGLIRYAHNLTPYRTMMIIAKQKAMRKMPNKTWVMAWEEALKNVPDQDTRKKLQEFHSRATMLLLGQLVLSPGLLIFAVLPLTVIVLLRRQWSTLRNIYTDVRSKIPISFIEEEAAKS